MQNKYLSKFHCLTNGIKQYYKGVPVRTITVVSLLFGILASLWAAAGATETNGIMGGDIIRLHVIANSDCDTDQANKLKVRDAVLKYATPQFGDLNDPKNAKNIIAAHLRDIEQAAAAELAALGDNHTVRAELGYFDFPVKTYDNVTLPAGKYRAVRVVIGEGKGKNWWCVMFPPLCMVDAAHSGNQDKSVKIIQQNMSGYDVLSGGTKRPAFRIGFKLFEVFGGNRNTEYN